MITLLIVLDILIGNLTPYTINAVIIGIPMTKSFTPLLLYFLFMAFYDYRYLLNLLIIYLLFLLNKKMNRIFNDDPIIFVVKTVLFYFIYSSFFKLWPI